MKVPKFQSFKVLKFQNFTFQILKVQKLSKLKCHIFKNVGPHRLHADFHICKNNMFENDLVFFLAL